MSDEKTVWKLAAETMGAFAPYYRDVAVGKIRERGASDSWFGLLQARAVEPLPLTPQWLAAVTPYSAPSARDGILSSAVAGGQLQGDDTAGYTLTDEGRAVLAAFFDTAQGLIAGAPALSEAEMGRLNAAFGRLVFASSELPTPEQKPGLAASRWTDPGPDAPDTVTFDQYVTDLLGFRDDVHKTTWLDLEVDGRTWEAFTYVWRGDAHTAAELAEKLPRRGWSAADYAVSLDQLAERGWLQLVDGEWQITEAGKNVREAAEEETERLFFAGWNVLSRDELEDMESKLHILLSRVKEAAPEPEPA